MTTKTLFNQNKLKDLFFALVFLLLVGGAFLSYQRVEDLIKAGNLVTHTNVVKLRLESLIATIKDGESSQRGYLLTHDTSYLEKYKNILPKAHLIFNEIDTLVKDNPVQQKNSKAAKLLFNERFKILDDIKTKFDETGLFNKEDLKNGKIKMDAVRAALLTMQNEEDMLLAKRVKDKKKYEFISPLFILLFTLIVLVIIIYAFDRTRNDRQQLKTINNSLELKNEELIRAENFAQLLLDSSVDIIASFDTNLNYQTVNKRSTEIIEKDPNELVGKNVLDVYPNLAGTKTYQAMREALKGKVVHLDLMRGVNHTEKYFDVFFIPLFINGQITGLLSITRDITALVNANENLKSINAELERSNNELASFNYIASHDLQEPLRKIQIFTDRIIDEYKAEIPEKIKINFDRIINAASRMRKLIDALLSYSLANKGEIKFVPTDLNLLLQEVKEQIADADADDKMVIETLKLPIVNVVPVQFQQLLLNLLGNAVKYSKPNEIVHIKINAKYIDATEMTDENALPQKNYLRIQLSDNGIGFEQDYSNKIFGLFQRLHTKNEYSGTGIGLAICKKIMDNHNGFITASGTPGVGATFNLYLPV